MVSTPRKRNASRSPDGGKHHKRLVTSSPEEGEVDDTGPSVPNPTIAPISLPAKPKVPVPFPFKKKAEPGKNGALGDASDNQATPMNVFTKYEENARKDREDPRRQRPRPMGKSNGADHWEPPYGSEKSLLSRIGPPAGTGQYHPPRDSWDSRDRDRRRSPPRHSPRRSRSPSPPPAPYHRGEKHRLPAPRSPGNFSPPSTQFGLDRVRDRSRERGYDRDRDRERERERDRDRSRDRHVGRNEDSRRYVRRNSPTDDGRHYRPDYRRDDREWTRRDDSYPPERDRPSRGDDRRYDYDRRHDSARYADSRQPSPPPPHRRPGSPRPPPSLPPRPVSPPSAPPPPSLPPPPPTESPKPAAPSVSPPPPPSLPDTGPRPPSSTPPPAPPPDVRLMKDPQLPPIHAQVKITMKRPEAPVNAHSPLPLELPPVSTAKAMARGPEMKSERPPPPREQQLEIRPPPQKEPEQPKLKIIRRRLPNRRSNKQDVLAYGHGFVGCGQQSDYEATTKLGEGTFGEVHKAIHKADGTLVALKRILMHNEKEGMPVTALREIKILKALKHPSIVNILDMFVVRSTDKDPLSVYMVFPYMDHDLAGLLENERVQLQPSHIKLYMKQLLEGTEYMHRNHILHRDMKAANLLISNDGSLKIADFGLARSFDATMPNRSVDGTQRGRERKYTNCVVTRWYRPPELLLGARQYGGEVDIWGIGCVLGEMFTRRPILPGTSDLDQLEKIWILCGSPNQHNWPYFDQLPGCEGVRRFNTNHSRKVRQTFDSMGPETVDLLDKLLVLNPRERLTAAQALDHDYFWTDPLPADPKTMPSYEASHEFDKRGHRHHQPMPAIPPPQRHPQGHIQPPPPNNYNNRGPKGGPYGDMNRRGHGPPPPAQYPQPHPPPPAHPQIIPPHVPNHPAYRGLPPPHLPLPTHPYPPGPPALPPGPPMPYGGPPQPNVPGGYPGYAPIPVSGYPHPPRMPPHQHHMQGRGQGNRREFQRNNNNSGSRLPANPNLPAKPPAPLGLANSVGGGGGGGGGGGRENDRDRQRDRGGPSDRPRGDPSGDSFEDPPPELNYG